MNKLFTTIKISMESIRHSTGKVNEIFYFLFDFLNKSLLNMFFSDELNFKN